MKIVAFGFVAKASACQRILRDCGLAAVVLATPAGIEVV
jgi:hypothetical protein